MGIHTKDPVIVHFEKKLSKWTSDVDGGSRCDAGRIEMERRGGRLGKS